MRGVVGHRRTAGLSITGCAVGQGVGRQIFPERPNPETCASSVAWSQSSGRRARCRRSNNRLDKPGTRPYRLRALWTYPRGRERLVVGMRKDAGSCGPPTHDRPSHYRLRGWTGGGRQNFPERTPNL